MKKKKIHILSREQYVGAGILFGITVCVWLFVALWPQKPLPKLPQEEARPNYDSIRQARWEYKKDSFRIADSLRYLEWSAEREQRYDSFRHEDSLRIAQWKIERQERYDDYRKKDSLWRDSIGWKYARHVKIDTILNLNTTDTAELQFIRGIGPYKARKIIAYRNQLGGFYSPLQLIDSTLSDLHMDSLIGCFTAREQDVKTLNINSCSIDVLAKHPYLRYRQAKAIYEYRRKHIRLESIDDLKNVPELSEKDIVRLQPYLDFE